MALLGCNPTRVIEDTSYLRGLLLPRQSGNYMYSAYAYRLFAQLISHPRVSHSTLLLFTLNLKVSLPMLLTPRIKTSFTLHTLASTPKVFIDRQNMLTIPA
jgi:hypothetical protein